LQHLTKLESLDIKNTDINEVNLSKLPESLQEIVFSSGKRPESKVKEITQQLALFNSRKFWAERGFSLEQAQE
jgi:hypothetical protein